MGFLLFRAFLAINAFNIATESPIYKYRFKVYPVDTCPMNASEFESAARRRNCTGNSRYLCAPDIYLSNLIEFCTDRNRLFYGKGNCVRLEGTGDLNHYSCVDRFTSGCPTEPYQDDKIFEYPMCLAINRESKCFISEKNCPERSKEDDERNKGKPEDYVSSYSYVIFIFMIALAFVVFGATLLILRKEIKKRTEIKRMKNNHLQMDEKNITYELLQEDEANDKDVQEDDRNDEMQINENALREYLSKGELTIQHIRCIIVGCAGAGKTTLLSRLKNIPYEELKKIESTEIIDVHVNIFEVNKEEETIKCVDEMNKLPLIIIPSNVIKNDNKTEEEIVADESVQSKRESEEIVQEKKNSTEKSGTHGISSMERKEFEIYKRVEDMREKKELLESYENNNSKVDAQDDKKIPNTPDKNSPTIEEETFLQLNKNTTLAHHVDENHAISKIMDALKQLSNEKDLRPRITFLDFAGQSLYYAFHQIYLSPKTCYILVVDMTKRFNERPDTDKECASRFTRWTYGEYYKFWLKSIDSFSDTDAPVVVVGTHADELSKDECENFFQTFYDFVDKHFDLRRHLNRKRHYTIGFPEYGSNLDELKDIKKCIASLVHDPEKIKPVWAMFEHILENEKENKVISRKSVSNINETFSKEFRLTDSDITDMLLFLHRVGTLLYFDENRLRDTIILDIQWFAQAFKCIVFYDVGLQKNDPKVAEFLETGEIDDDVLETIWENKDALYIAKKKEILLYMEQLGLLATCKTEKNSFYYIPSMNKREFKDDGKHINKSSTLCFHFQKHGQLPVYLFDIIVIKCLKIPGWSILQEKKTNCIYDKVACFSYRCRIVVMCLCKFQIQVQLRALADQEIAQGLLEEVQNLVKDKIEECKKYKFDIGYLCEKGKFNDEEKDFFIAFEEFSVAENVCPKCPLSKKHPLGKDICWVQTGTEIRKIMKHDILMWKEDDKAYIETHTFQAMLEKVRNQPFVTFVGVPGSGKTATARHIALILQAEGYEILPINEIMKIETYCDPDNPQVFLIDDVLGVIELDGSKLKQLNRYENRIKSPIMSKSKTLMTCREVVYRNDVISHSFLTIEDNVVQLHSNENALSSEDKNQTQLTAACEKGHSDIVFELIMAGADVNLSGGVQTPLTTACENGHLGIVKQLIIRGADVNRKVSKRTPLTAACEKGHLDVVFELIKAGADVNLFDGVQTPLTAACKIGHLEEVTILIRAGANVNLRDRNQTGADVNFETPLTAACENGHLDVVKKMIMEGADVNRKVNKQTPLTAACVKGHPDVVLELIKAGADINFETPLTAACENGYLGIVKQLIKKGADVSRKVNKQTPLTAACEKGHLDVVFELIKAGADVNFETPLTAACENGHSDIVKKMIMNGADVNRKVNKQTPLTAACENGHFDVVLELIMAGADVNFETPLTAACEKGYSDVVLELIKAGADVNLFDGVQTPLTAACKNGHLEEVTILIRAGANVNLRDRNQTPLEVGLEREHWDIVAVLIEAGAFRHH